MQFHWFLQFYQLKVIDFAVENFHEKIGVEEMAEISGMSRYHFSRLFSVYTGKSPGKFLRHLRLKKALRLLQFELVSVKELAERCGFSNQSYLCRAFKSEYGKSPSVYRRKKKMNRLFWYRIQDALRVQERLLDKDFHCI